MSATRSEGAVPHGAARYGAVAIVLHWVIALAIIMQLILATRMEGRTPEAFAVIQLHKSIGITILLLSLVRLGWRLTHHPPPEPPLARWERTLSGAVHVGFYVIMIAMPLTGWLMVSASRLGLPTLLYGVVPWPHIPGVAELAAPQKKLAHEIGEAGHYYLAWAAIGLLALHVAGALKHQLFSADEPVLGRMAPGAKAGRWREPRLLLIAAGAAAAALFAWTVSPPLARSPAPGPSAAPAPEVQAAAPSASAPPLATPAAVEPAPSSPAPSPTEPAAVATWTPSSGSTLDFETAWSGQAIRGRFAKWTAQIVFAPEALDKSSVVVRVDLRSAETGDGQRDGMLTGPDWLDAGSKSTAVFTAKRFTTAPGGFVAHGTLALRGVNKPLDVPFKVTFSGNGAEAAGTAEIDRGAYGVGPGADEGGDQVPAKVKVEFSVKARKGG